MSMPLSPFVPAYPSPSLCPQVHSLRLRFYSCPAASEQGILENSWLILHMNQWHINSQEHVYWILFNHKEENPRWPPWRRSNARRHRHADDRALSHQPGNSVSKPWLYSQLHKAPGTATRLTCDHLLSIHLAFCFPKYKYWLGLFTPLGLNSCYRHPISGRLGQPGNSVSHMAGSPVLS